MYNLKTGDSLRIIYILAVIVSMVTPTFLYAETVVINEVMFNPDGNENAREYVELFNLSVEPVSLEGFIIGDGTGFDNIVPVKENEWTVPGKSFALIMDPDYFDSGELYEGIPSDTPIFTVVDKAIGLRGLSNSAAEPVSLISGAGDTLSVVTYSLDCPPGHSWERIMPEGEDTITNFAPSVKTGGTPGQNNSVTPPAHNPAMEEGSIRFIPSSPHMGEALRIAVSYRNKGLEPVSGVEVTVRLEPDIHIGTVSFAEELEPGEVSPEASLYFEAVYGGRLAFTAFVVSGETNYTADDTLHVMFDVEVPLGTLILNEVMAGPEDRVSEWVEVMNTGNSSVDLFNWGVLDRTASAAGIVSGHVFIKAYGYSVLASELLAFSLPEDAVSARVEDFPRLNNDGDTVKLLDFTGAFSDSMAYDDAPEGISLELISEAYKSSVSGWDACVDESGSTPGRLNSISYTSDVSGEKKIPLSLNAAPNPFAEHVTISYRLPFPAARVSLYVYDRRGRLVARLRDAEESGPEWSDTWDGKSGGSRLPAGPYILSIEALDKRTGRMISERKTIVAGAKL